MRHHPPRRASGSSVSDRTQKGPVSLRLVLGGRRLTPQRHQQAEATAASVWALLPKAPCFDSTNCIWQVFLSWQLHGWQWKMAATWIGTPPTVHLLWQPRTARSERQPNESSLELLGVTQWLPHHFSPTFTFSGTILLCKICSTAALIFPQFLSSVHLTYFENLKKIVHELSQNWPHHPWSDQKPTATEWHREEERNFYSYFLVSNLQHSQRMMMDGGQFGSSFIRWKSTTA